MPWFGTGMAQHTVVADGYREMGLWGEGEGEGLEITWDGRLGTVRTLPGKSNGMEQWVWASVFRFL
jgi:hypothetical protein